MTKGALSLDVFEMAALMAAITDHLTNLIDDREAALQDGEHDYAVNLEARIDALDDILSRLDRLSDYIEELEND